MADLASISDVTARSPRTLTAGEQTRATTLLGDASARIRTHTGRQFAAVSNATVVLRPTGAYLEMPQVPVTAVHEVRGILDDGTVGEPVTGWIFDGIDRIDITTAGFGFGDPWWPWPFGPDAFQVLYDYDDGTVPADVVRICVGMVLRTILAPSPTEGMSAERVGQYSYQMSQQVNGGSPGPTVRLTEQDKLELREAGYGPRPAGSIQVRL